ncbi:MAG: diguanylate cyclase [Zoogloea sp.]|nr:diguanylate cyclase [Zoogloea sp.]
MFAFLNHLSVRNRIWAIVAIFIGGIMLGSALDILMLREALTTEKELKTRQLVENGFGVLSHYRDLQLRGELTEEAAKAAAIGTLKAMRHDGGEYFWLNDLGTPFPRMIMNPLLPALDGKVLDADEFNCATSMRVGENGSYVPTGGRKNFFAAIVEVARQGGQGYVAYNWPKPAADGRATEKRYPKLSYVMDFQPWGWVIGSGIYIDDIDQAVRTQAMHHLLVVLGIAATALLLAAVMARSITRPLRMVMAAMHAIGEGGGRLAHRLPVEGSSEIDQLAAGFNEMLDRLRARDAELALHQEYLEAEVSRRTLELRETNLRLEAELVERRHAEHEMRESRARMRALFDASGESVLLLEPEGKILAINAFGARRFGMLPEEMAGRNFFDLLPSDVAGNRRAAVFQAVASGEPGHLQDRRGAVFFDNNIYPVKDEAGVVESVAVYAKDVTEQHRTKQVDDIFSRLDMVLLKWRMNMESIAQMFCDDILPVFDLAATWIGRAEKDGRLAMVAGAEVAGGDFLARIRATVVRWDDQPACCLPAGAAIRSGTQLHACTDDADCRSCAAATHAIGAHEVLLLPITLRGESWGVLAFYGRDPHQMEEERLSARLASIAGRLGFSLEAALQQEWLTLLDAALAGVGNAVLITDAEARILWANPAFSRLSGYPVDEILGRTPAMLKSGVQDGEFYRQFWQTIRSGRTWHGEIVNIRHDGSRYTASQTVTPLLNASGEVTHYVAIVEDITERKAMEARIQHAANFDLLTDLPNRGLFFDRLGQALALARRNGQAGALLFLDLDRFKEVNDRFGHAAGDKLLVAVAERLRGQVRESDTVARLAGDEFTVILPQLRDHNDARHVAEKILAALSRPLDIAGHAVSIGGSIGIALFPDHAESVEQILNAADHAMYQAKQAGRNTIRMSAEAASSKPLP